MSTKTSLDRVRWLFSSAQAPTDRYLPRWLFLRALGLIYFSAFCSLVFQIRGLIGPEGILPANEYLEAVAHSLSHLRGLWFAPTLFWFSAGTHMLIAVCWVGLIASLLLASMSGPAECCSYASSAFSPSSAPHRIFPATNLTACCSRPALSHFFMLRQDFVPAGVSPRHRPAPACSYFNGNGFASTSNPGSPNSRAAIQSGGTSPRWITTIRMALCPPGSAGTCSICRTGFTHATAYHDTGT